MLLVTSAGASTQPACQALRERARPVERVPRVRLPAQWVVRAARATAQSLALLRTQGKWYSKPTTARAKK